MRNLVYIAVLVASGILLYAHVLFEPFKVDNLPQIVNDPRVHSLDHLFSLFFGGMGYSKENFDYFRFYWRPINMVLNPFLWVLGGGSVFPFHAFQIAVFIANGVLFYIFLKKLITPGFAFAFALLFLITPTNMEVADYIAILQDTMYFFFGIAALCVAAYKLGKQNLRPLLLGLLLMASLLSKETGVLFMILIVIWAKLFDPKVFKSYLAVCLVVAATYLFMRYFAAQNVYTLLLVTWSPSVGVYEKLLVVLNSVRFNIEELILPGGFNFAANAQKNINLASALIAVGEVIALVSAMVTCAFLLRVKNKAALRVFVFFCAWVVVGILFHSQIFTLEAFTARRWLYVSTAGFFGALAVAVSTFYKPTRGQKALLVTMFIVLVVFFVAQHFYTKVEIR